MTELNFESHRWARLASTHRGLALKGLRDPQGQLEEQLWGNTFELYTLSGPVDIGRLERAIRDVVRRQLAFRSRFALRDGEDVFATAAGPYLKLETLRKGSALGGTPDEASAWLQERLTHCAREPFHLQTDPLTRVVLCEHADGSWRMAITQDHSISDAWTLKLLVNAVMQEYRRTPPADRGAEPREYDGSYFDWYETLGRTASEVSDAAWGTWGAVTDAAGLLTSRPAIPGGRWLPRAYRRLERQFLYRFTADEQRRLKERAERLRCGLGDLLLAGAQLGMLAISRACPPISYIYSGRREPSTWRTMGLFCEELLTLPVPPVEDESLDSWMTRFLNRNQPRSSMGDLGVLDFHSARSEENLVTYFNFLPPRRGVQADSDVRLDAATRKEYEALEMPEHASRFGIVMRVWDSDTSPMELRMSVDPRMCPRPDRAALAMLHGALAHGGGHVPLSEALETVRSLWSETAAVESAPE